MMHSLNFLEVSVICNSLLRGGLQSKAVWNYTIYYVNYVTSLAIYKSYFKLLAGARAYLHEAL